MKPLGPQDPRRIGGYRLLRLLGSGGMGRVYLARSPGGRFVAVKVVRPELSDDPGFRARFAREVDAARRVGARWTAPVVDADVTAEHPWLVTAYVPGPSLHEAVVRYGPLPPEAARALGAGLADALTAIHDAGVVHRDLKPSNVVLALDGPRVIDFGISRAADAGSLTRTGETVGSPGFMSPEQIDGDPVGPPSDVFSLGSVLAYAATGTGPYGEGSAQALLFRIVAGEPRLDGLPGGLRDVVAACLRKDPAERPPAEDVRAELAGGAGTEALFAGPWLPPAIADDISRHAVALLDLETGPDEADIPTYVPPPPSPPPYAHAPAPPGAPASPPPYGYAPGAPASAPPHAPGPWPSPGASGAGFGPSAAPGFGSPAPSGPARRRAGWIAAGAAVALVAVVALVIALLPRGGDGGRERVAETSPAAPGTGGVPVTAPATGPATGRTATTGPTGSPRDGAVPAAYLGRWKGQSRSDLGLVGQVDAVVTAGRTGDTVVDSTVVYDSLGTEIRCSGRALLVAVEDRGLLLEDIPGSGEGTTIGGIPACSSGGRFRLDMNADGTLQFTSLAPGTGNATGALRKAS